MKSMQRSCIAPGTSFGVDGEKISCRSMANYNTIMLNEREISDMFHENLIKDEISDQFHENLNDAENCDMFHRDLAKEEKSDIFHEDLTKEEI